MCACDIISHWVCSLYTDHRPAAFASQHSAVTKQLVCLFFGLFTLVVSISNSISTYFAGHGINYTFSLSNGVRFTCFQIKNSTAISLSLSLCVCRKLARKPITHTFVIWFKFTVNQTLEYTSLSSTHCSIAFTVRVWQKEMSMPNDDRSSDAAIWSKAPAAKHQPTQTNTLK